MGTQETTPAGSISRQRLEAISDGVMAVAITLLALNIAVPMATSGRSLWEAFDTDSLGSIGLFALSFLLIARFWLLHHDVFRGLPDSLPQRGSFVTLNFLFLMMVCLMPFSTRLYSANNDEVLAVAIYSLTIAAASALVSALSWTTTRSLSLRIVLVLAILLAAIPFAWLVSPMWAPAVWLLLIVVPDAKTRPTAS